MKTRTVVIAVTAALFVATVVAGVLVLSRVTSDPHPVDARGRVSEAAAETADAAAGAAGAAGAASVGTEAQTGSAAVAAEAMDILSGWDADRAAAYAAGDVADLRALYLPGSRTGRADVRLLRDYVDRGLQVEGMRMQVLGFEVVERSRARLVLRVTDRLVGAVAVGGGRRFRLPADRADERRVTLLRRHGSWLVTAVH